MSQWNTLQPQAEPDIDELDDEEEEEEDDANIDPATFKIRNPLGKPSSTPYRLKDLHTMMHMGQVDLEAPYQRDVVWNSVKQMALIDSIFHNYPVPPPIFNIRHEDGDKLMVCVDGKQRLTSIQRFFDGEIWYTDKRTKMKWFWALPSNSKRGLRLPQHARDNFADRTLWCTEYYDLGIEMERDVFQRVQLGVPLSKAEIMQAAISPWNDWFAELVSKFVDPLDGLSKYIKWDTTRAKAHQNIGSLALACWSHPEYSLPTAGAVGKFIMNESAPEKTFKSHINTVLATLLSLAGDANYNKPFLSWKRLSPAEFVWSGFLIYRLVGDVDVTDNDGALNELSQHIFNLRTLLQGKHSGNVFINGRVCKTAYDFVISVNKGEHLRRIGNRERGKDAGGSPRKRKNPAEPDDGDYRPRGTKRSHRG